MEKLTPEQERIIIECRDEWLDRGLKDKTFDILQFRKGIDWIYNKCGFTPPEIIVVDSPMAAQQAANFLLENENTPIEIMQAEVNKALKDFDPEKKVPLENFSPYGSISDYGWVSFYDAMDRIGVDLGPKKEEFMLFKEFLKAGHYDFIALDKAAIVCMKFETVRIEDGRCHASDGPSIVWKDGYQVYAVHGRMIPGWVFTEEITKEKFVHENRVEIRAAMYARLGQKSMMDLLGAKLMDTCMDNDEVLKLWKTEETFKDLEGQPMAWVECTCPSTGTAYLLGCEPEHKTAKGAMAASWGLTEEEYTVDDHT